MVRRAVAAICARAGTDFIVTGHTMHRGRIETFGERIFDIDVGMTPAYGANLPQALIASAQGIHGFDATGRERLLVPFGEAFASASSVG